MEGPKGKHIFGTVTVGSKGQIVIPKKARDVFGIQPTNAVVASGSITLTFLAQASDITVKVRVS